MLALNKKQRSTSKSLSSCLTEKEDLLLPTPLNLTNHTPASMLLDDSHLQLSDNDFKYNQSDGNDNARNWSEGEITISWCLSVCF